MCEKILRINRSEMIFVLAKEYEISTGKISNIL